jgi:hypothetical protein
VIIHLYCVAWNEMHMLDFFFRHYDGLVSKYFFHDDGSDDGTLDYLARRSDVELCAKPFLRPDSFVMESLGVYETSWHRSRGQADWVILVDIDEHIHHPDLPGYLAAQQAAGVTAIPALGFQMLSPSYPPAGLRLIDALHRGAPWKQMSKLALLRPDAVQATNFTVGRHTAAPEGDIRYPERDELLLAHYKYLGLDYISRRHAAAYARRRSLDLAKNWGHRYSFDAAQLAADFADFESRAIDIRDMTDPHEQHKEPRWWR